MRYDEEKLRKHQVMCRICVKCNSNAFANLGRLKTHTNTFEWRMDNNPTAERDGRDSAMQLLLVFQCIWVKKWGQNLQQTSTNQEYDED